MKKNGLYVKPTRDSFDIQNGSDASTTSSRRDFLKLSATATCLCSPDITN
jgi:hypothetical protein